MLAATIHSEIRAKSPTIYEDEVRLTSAGTWEIYRRQTERPGSFVNDDILTKAARSTGNTLKIPAYNKKTVTVRNTRPLIISDDENTSGFITASWTTFAFGFTMRPMQHFNNEMKYFDDWIFKYESGAAAMQMAIENAAVANSEAGKTQVIGLVTGDNLAFTAGNVVSETGISAMKDSYVLSQLRPMRQSNDYTGRILDISANQGLYGAMTMMEGFKDYNQENKAIQFLNNNFYFSNQIANATGKKATGFAIGGNQVGMATRVEPDSIFGTRLQDGHEWGTMYMPELGITVGTYYYENAIDMSGLHAGTAWGTRTSLEAFDFAVDICFLRKHNSAPATNASDIIKFDIETA